MMLNIAESSQSYISCQQRLGKTRIENKGKGKKSIHFNGSDDTIELILRTVISVNQLSVHGAVADLCIEMARDSRGAEKPAATD